MKTITPRGKQTIRSTTTSTISPVDQWSECAALRAARPSSSARSSYANSSESVSVRVVEAPRIAEGAGFGLAQATPGARSRPAARASDRSIFEVESFKVSPFGGSSCGAALGARRAAARRERSWVRSSSPCDRAGRRR